MPLLLHFYAFTRRRDKNRHKGRVGTARENLNSILTRYNEVIREIGKSDSLRVHGSPAGFVSSFENFSFLERVRTEFRIDFIELSQRLQQSISDLRTELLHGKSSEEDPSSVSQIAGLSQRLVTAKKGRSEVFERLAELRAQVQQFERAEHDLSARVQASKDLLRLKQSGIGILPEAECPTCGQLVSPARLKLEDHNARDVETHTTALERELKTISKKKHSLVSETIAASVELQKIEAEYEDTSMALKLINQATQPLRESLIRISSEIMRNEKTIDLYTRVRRRLNEIQGEWDQEFAKAKALHSSTSVNLDAEKSIIRAFEQRLGQTLWSLRHNAVQREDLGAIELDSRYNPILRHRNLQILGSASDRARLILAYVWALASVATRHPGVLILDEPVQQNPDRLHIEHLVEFLIANKNLAAFQAIVITYLPDDVINRLRAAGVGVDQLTPGRRFLNLVEPNVLASR